MRISDWSSDVCSSDLQAPGLGDQRPRMVDRLFLEIVAEGEIPQHFKESMMPRRIADIVEIIMLAARAHAFLRRYRGAVRALLQPRADILDRHHARVYEPHTRAVLRPEAVRVGKK